MGHKFAEIAFTDSVKKMQHEQGSRENYAPMDEGEDYHNAVGEQEAMFIAQRDSFYMSSISETGWPYVQHRGGPRGFMRVLDENTLGFADYRGNRQYVSTGNFLTNNRVSLIFMDYLNRRRLKILGHVRLVGKNEPELLSQLSVQGYRALVERGLVITVDAFDWNCPQHITPRYTKSEFEESMTSLIEENKNLKQQLGDLR